MWKSLLRRVRRRKLRRRLRLRDILARVGSCVLLGASLLPPHALTLAYSQKGIYSYMLRYLKAVQMMKAIIEENNLMVMATIARYATAYEAIEKPDWWDKSKR